mmetsp:Transcript_20953/g.27176  ORF Transcript_20953/g.27176 Transcript_20953/m.27176 type:complete len:234 (+) Transcript_20953:168-869(+)|eukprot:CAMPEP_0197286206 /NCGR_PEP_ID=MMETSP0890-20130614/1677_1 /TAXON_ID=44058 ORGANISM="Aureoumbra lagunensis, Strain CCMP1510" /NCGR_SAMPLE_ID=MMETSP0890 /ASSEMBLY_ACC=CAM_ASM_000533 /LENGTH=233 /DNA_ID=CAMNT_0042754413 /DNA_START=143 /DNA_END=844 /DNA_ORIENTATION=+
MSALEEMAKGNEPELDEDEDDDDDDDDVPELDEVDQVEDVPPAGADDAAAGAGGEDGTKGKQNRSEKKNRKAMQKLGMKTVTNIMRVTVKKSKNILFAIQQPDVFKSSSSDTYVIFGEAKIEDLSAQAQQTAAQQFQVPDLSKPGMQMPGTSMSQMPGAFPAQPAAVQSVLNAGVQNQDGAADDEATEVDETGVEAKDIELVMAQANCTRAKAVSALKSNDNDIVNAIMYLTM